MCKGRQPACLSVSLSVTWILVAALTGTAFKDAFTAALRANSSAPCRLLVAKNDVCVCARARLCKQTDRDKQIRRGTQVNVVDRPEEEHDGTK